MSTGEEDDQSGICRADGLVRGWGFIRLSVIAGEGETSSTEVQDGLHIEAHADTETQSFTQAVPSRTNTCVCPVFSLQPLITLLLRRLLLLLFLLRLLRSAVAARFSLQAVGS